MSWKDKLQKASFRGAVFGVFDAETLFGRRNELHEFPLRDIPFAEDLGKKAREFTINAFIIGIDYLGGRDALISAIEDNATPGTLIHPTLGTMSVIPKDCRVKYNNLEGGLEYFTLTFVEAGENKYPSVRSNTSFFSASYAKEALTKFKDDYASQFSVSGLPDFIHQHAVQNTDDLSDYVLNILGFGNTDSDSFSDYSKTVADFSENATTSVFDPTSLGQQITDIVSGLTDVYLDTESTTNSIDPTVQALAAQKRLVTFGDDLQVIPLTTTSRVQQAKNQIQFINLVKNSSLVEMVRITSEMEFESRQDAIRIRDEVDEYILEQLLILADSAEDTAYLALNKARVAMIKDINTRAANLKNIKYYRTYDSIPAMVLAYDQYEDATKDEEVIKRNHIRNPLFVPGNSNIEVLV